MIKECTLLTPAELDGCVVTAYDWCCLITDYDAKIKQLLVANEEGKMEQITPAVQ